MTSNSPQGFSPLHQIPTSTLALFLVRCHAAVAAPRVDYLAVGRDHPAQGGGRCIGESSAVILLCVVLDDDPLTITQGGYPLRTRYVNVRLKYDPGTT